MKRTDFMQIIKLRSCWKIDKKKGNYELPNGERLSVYITGLVESQMQLDNLGITSNGNLAFCTGGKWNTDTKEFDDYTLMPDFADNETCTYDEMERRIKRLVSEIIGQSLYSVRLNILQRGVDVEFLLGMLVMYLIVGILLCIPAKHGGIEIFGGWLVTLLCMPEIVIFGIIRFIWVKVIHMGKKPVRKRQNGKVVTHWVKK